MKTHVTRLLQKLDLRDRAQAIVLAYQTGLFAELNPVGLLLWEDPLSPLRPIQEATSRRRAAPLSIHNVVAMITIENLSKKYGGNTVVHDITFKARPGRVTGFLGPNGAGKSTSMRMMVGLTTPTSGTATINGRRFADLPNPGLEVGVMLDASAEHAGRTGREILTIAQQIMGVPTRRVDEVPNWSGYRERGPPRVVNYSLGMRQRLAVAVGAAQSPEAAYPGPARQRARPGRHPGDARSAP